MDLGEKIRSLRKQKGISMEVLAQAVGVKKAAIGHIETGVNNPSPETLKKIAEYFKVTFDYLLKEDTADRPAEGLEVRVAGLEKEMKAVKKDISGANVAINAHSLALVDIYKRMVGKMKNPIISAEELEKHVGGAPLVKLTPPKSVSKDRSRTKK